MARLAGVSPGTVSHVLNHPHRVTPHTRARVQAAIDELGFAPDRRARALAGGASTLIGFIVVDLTNSYFVDMARGAQEAAQDAGMTVLLADSAMSADRELTYLQLLDEERFAGILLVPRPTIADDVWRSRSWTRDIVLLNAQPVGDRCGVAPDDELGGYKATRHLIERGRRDLVFAGGPFTLHPVAARHRGAQRAVAETNGGVRLSTVATEGLRPRHGREVGDRLAQTRPADRPDGVVAAADLLGLGVVQALAGRPGLSVPDDLSVVGYDNNQASWESPVPLTTVAQPGHEIGRTAVRLLLEEMRERASHQHQQVLLEPSLVVRSSS
ncbi:LacI family DNA-binding transcriptional regulator [Nocardioides sp.]|uniref:LacI family DNA-binding transcriptional regulator n=1 Tax=Nocardioides sp. TaxID=35761 RepID=UPI00271F8837|nr:LacI family DNA-binding transcriptional regulator [Nocardioides sp.]MDO9457329.1 LacI family DNA-binding transcriptional regulator [Nocardioides sp.]